MTDKSPSTIGSSLEEAIELLRPGVRDKLEVRSGYIDLLRQADNPSESIGARAFQKKWVPSIYERFWRPLAARFLFGRGLTEAEERDLIVEKLSLSPGDRALDVGCGPGNYTRLVADAVGNGLVVGIDASEPMISAAVQRGGNTSLAYVLGDGDDLPFVDEQFDAVCCVGAIHLLKEPMAALDAMVRMLAPGGRVALAASCRKGWEPLTKTGVTVFEKDELTGAFAAHGLTQIEQRVAKRWQIVSARRPQQ